MPKTTLLRKQVTPVGSIQPHAGPTAPDGFLLCDGSIVDIADYPKLYAAIGTSWGHGNEVSEGVSDGLTFHLPDLRGRFLRGVDNPSGITGEEAGRDPNRLTRTPSNAGGNTGDAVGSVQGDATAKKGLSLANLTGSRNVTSHNGHAHGFVWGRGNASDGGDGGNMEEIGTGTTNVTQSTNSGGNHRHTLNISHGHALSGDDETRPLNANVNYVIKAF